MDAGLAVEAVDRLLSAPPHLNEQQSYRPAPRKPADWQRTNQMTGRG
jgi:hypothetical protein